VALLQGGAGCVGAANGRGSPQRAPTSELGWWCRAALGTAVRGTRRGSNNSIDQLSAASRFNSAWGGRHGGDAGMVAAHTELGLRRCSAWNSERNDQGRGARRL
jgi:hypothetical protein